MQKINVLSVVDVARLEAVVTVEDMLDVVVWIIPRAQYSELGFELINVYVQTLHAER